MVDRELTEFSVDLHQVRYLAEPGGNSLTLIQLLHGELFLQSGDRFNSLREGAIALVNRHTDWILEGAGENAVMVITLTGQWIARWYPDFFLYDYQQTPQSDQERWNSALRNALHQVLLATVIKDEPRYRLELNRWLSELMLILIAGFQQPTQAHSSRHQHWSRRITQVVQRIEANVGRRISLGEIARAEFVSQAWLSKLFRREVGVSFMQFITALRLQNAVKALRSTSKPVHQIALEQGFANNRQMIDLFKRHYGKTPRQFRRAPHNAPPASVRDESTPKHSVHAVPSHLLFTLLRRTQTASARPRRCVLKPAKRSASLCRKQKRARSVAAISSSPCVRLRIYCSMTYRPSCANCAARCRSTAWISLSRYSTARCLPTTGSRRL
jgi:AraC-like DNA-binding protein